MGIRWTSDKPACLSGILLCCRVNPEKHTIFSKHLTSSRPLKRTSNHPNHQEIVQRSSSKKSQSQIPIEKSLEPPQKIPDRNPSEKNHPATVAAWPRQAIAWGLPGTTTSAAWTAAAAATAWPPRAPAARSTTRRLRRNGPVEPVEDQLFVGTTHGKRRTMDDCLVVVTGCHEFWHFRINIGWECHHPNWRRMMMHISYLSTGSCEWRGAEPGSSLEFPNHLIVVGKFMGNNEEHGDIRGFSPWKHVVKSQKWEHHRFFSETSRVVFVRVCLEGSQKSSWLSLKRLFWW